MRCQPFNAGDTLAAQGTLAAMSGLILSGTVSMQDPDLGLSVQLTAGDLFGMGATPPRQLATWQALAGSAGVVAWIAPQALQALCEAQPALAYRLPSLESPAAGAPLTAGGGDTGLNLLGTPIRALIKREPITLAPSASIRAAAELMREKRVSSVLLVEQDHLFGLVTDRDLRNRVVAPALDIQRPVSDIATLAPLTVEAASPAFEALLTMARHNIHHLPVMDGKRIAGMITATDLTEQHSTSAVYLAGDIYKQSSVEGLAQISGKVRQLQQNLAAADASAYSTGHIITAITDALTIR
ncbi:MAG: CBS domain-containing protein, partial [Burkholderiaceae bacterium]|nr:CBS domain-containing protein [Burkholderiaceae bacterium]